MPDLEFDAASHTYRYEGRVLPSVSAIIRDLSMADLRMVPPEVLREAAEFGTRVHALTEEYDRANAAWLGHFYDLPEREWRCLEAWASFRHDMRWQNTHIEHRVRHHALGYAGTIDRLGVFHNPDTGLSEQAIIDIKTSDPHDWHGVQLAGYHLAARSEGLIPTPGWMETVPACGRYAVYLRDDGTYRLRRYDSPEDTRVFLQQLRQTLSIPF